MIEVRRVDEAFSHSLAELWATTFKQAYDATHSTENIRAYCSSNYTVDAARATLSDPRVVCKVAFKSSTAIGFYVVKHHACPVPLDGASSELKQIYLMAPAYGSGVGRMLLNDASDVIRKAGRSWMWLAVSDRNVRAQSFYRKFAFQPLGCGPVFEVGSDRLTSTLMGLDIRLSGAPSR